MKLKPSTVQELRKILVEEFSLDLDGSELEKLAYSLLGYFDLLVKIKSKHEFRNSSARLIDSKTSPSLNKKKEK